MNQQKFGVFLRQLRREKGLTQEQLAEQLCVSNRSVSRWETGRNLPDFALLPQLAQLLGVGMEELLNGERKETVQTMERKTEDTLRTAAEYAGRDKQDYSRRLRLLFAAGAAAVFALMITEVLELPRTPLLSLGRGFLSGAAFGVLLLGVLSTTPAMARLRRAKLGLLRRLRPRRDSGKSEN